MSREYETWLIFAREDLQMAELVIANNIFFSSYLATVKKNVLWSGLANNVFYETKNLIKSISNSKNAYYFID